LQRQEQRNQKYPAQSLFRKELGGITTLKSESLAYFTIANCKSTSAAAFLAKAEEVVTLSPPIMASQT